MYESHDKPPRVLLVEDTPFLRYAFGRLLRLHGFDVCEANDGREALDCLAHFHPELVLTDLVMPLMNGFDLIRALRSDPKTADVPVVAFTADPTEQTEREARRAGAAEYFTKPVDFTSFVSRLRTLWT
jgi:CheY-like chemotaxis protein